MTQQRPWISSRYGSAPNVERGLRRERQGERGTSRCRRSPCPIAIKTPCNVI